MSPTGPSLLSQNVCNWGRPQTIRRNGSRLRFKGDEAGQLISCIKFLYSTTPAAAAATAGTTHAAQNRRADQNADAERDADGDERPVLGFAGDPL